MNKFFAAFVMTYERADILNDTIERILNQSLPPEKILIVDNSESWNTGQMVEELKNPKIVYHRVGYNAGPAGAAKVGLEMLANEGYQWINWGDDDNPPHFEDTFEKLLSAAEDLRRKGIKVGAVGSSGSRFNSLTGGLIRLKRNELNEMVLVDSISANKLIINADAARSGLLPDEKLFFGFEELDYCFQLRQHGYRLYCHGPLLLQHRDLFHRKDKVEVTTTIITNYQIQRKYYSYRNLLYIILHKHHYYFTASVLVLKWTGSTLMSLRFGIKHFKIRTTGFIRAIKDGLTGKWSSNITLNKKI